IEAEILRVTGTTPLPAHRWFPVVRRDLLNLEFDVSDEEFHVAIVGLVRKGALVDVETNCWRPPQWTAVPEALECAVVFKPHEKPQLDAPNTSPLSVQRSKKAL